MLIPTTRHITPADGKFFGDRNKRYRDNREIVNAVHVMLMDSINPNKIHAESGTDRKINNKGELNNELFTVTSYA